MGTIGSSHNTAVPYNDWWNIWQWLMKGIEYLIKNCNGSNAQNIITFARIIHKALNTNVLAKSHILVYRVMSSLASSSIFTWALRQLLLRPFWTSADKTCMTRRSALEVVILLYSHCVATSQMESPNGEQYRSVQYKSPSTKRVQEVLLFP